MPLADNCALNRTTHVLYGSIKMMDWTPQSTSLHSAFYRFTHVQDPHAVANAVRACAAGLTGSIIVAHEGISGAVAGNSLDVSQFERALQHAVLKRSLTFKHSGFFTAPFGRLKVSVKPELVALGLPNLANLPSPDEHDSSHLDAQAWHELLQREDVVVLDNRNHFEFRLGRFRAALDPGVHHFRDFTSFVLANAQAWREAGTAVAMYCTGGIRCDKTAPWLRSLGLQVWQLDGGILNYLSTTPSASEAWQGECFVFDNRLVLNNHLQEAGTTAAQVFDASHPDEAWRLQRALQLERTAHRPADGGKPEL